MNRIPRNFKYINGTILSGNAEGQKMTVTKDEYGYHAIDSDGKHWGVFVANLRNEHHFRIDEIIY